MAEYIELCKKFSENIEIWRSLFANTQMAIILSATQSKITEEVRAIELELQKNADHVQMSLLDLAPVRERLD